MITKFRSWCGKDKEPLAERTGGQYLSATNDIVLFIAARNPGTDGFTEEKTWRHRQFQPFRSSIMQDT